MPDKSFANNYDLYKVFCLVAKHKSLTKAAADLNVSQPAVSQSIKLLEERLGVKLTVRTGHGIKLTDEGQLLFPYVKKGCDAFEKGEAAILSRIASASDNGTTSLCGESYLISDYFRIPIETFEANNPEHSLTAISIHHNSIIKQVQNGDSEIGLICGPVKMPADLDFTQVGTVTDCFVTGTQYCHFANQKLPLRILEHLPVIVSRKGTPERDSFDAFIDSYGAKVNPSLELDLSEMVLSYTKRNMGIGFLPYSYVKKDLDKKEVYLLSFDFDIPKRPIYAVTVKNKPLSSAAVKLLESIKNS